MLLPFNKLNIFLDFITLLTNLFLFFYVPIIFAFDNSQKRLIAFICIFLLGFNYIVKSNTGYFAKGYSKYYLLLIFLGSLILHKNKIFKHFSKEYWKEIILDLFLVLLFLEDKEKIALVFCFKLVF